LIRDLLTSLEQMGSPDELAIANHSLKEGLYILIDADGKGCRELFAENDKEFIGELYESIRARDFYSALIEMNKPVDGKKKIHSNNIYSLAFKYFDPQKASSDEAKKNPVNIYSDSVNEHIDRYFNALDNWFNENRMILKKTSIKPVDKNESEKCKKIFIDFLPMLIGLVQKYNLKHGKYIKLFINEPVDKYKEASNLYLIPKIFNNNDYNIVIGGEIFGLSNANMGLNAKKPYLAHRTTKYGVPYRITLSEALDAYRLLMWLNSQEDNGRPKNLGYLPLEKSNNYSLLDDVTRNTPSQFLHMTRGKTGVVIDDYEVLPYTQKDLDKPFRLKNYLNLPDYEERLITEMRQLEKLIDEVLFSYYLVKSYYDDPVPVMKYPLSSRQAAIIQNSKNAFLSYFRKSNKTVLPGMIDRVSLEMILAKLNQYDYTRVEETYFAKALNLRFALLEYFEIGGKEELGSSIMNLYEKLNEIIKVSRPEKPLPCDNDELYYFAAGQLARYLVSQSKAQAVKYSFITPLLRAKNSAKVKEELISLLNKYGYDRVVYGGDYRSPFENLLFLISSYDCADNLNKVDLILAGFTAPNVLSK